MENKIKELKIRILKESLKRKAIRKEVARTLTKQNAGEIKK